MAFSNVNVLTTREIAFGARWLGQILAVPTGRLDKVSVYLEPIIADPTAAQSIDVIVEAYDLDTFGNPTGSPLASDFKILSDITVSGFQNFRLEGNVPTVVAIVVRVPNGDVNNHIAWRYTSVSSGGEELLISSSNGAVWIQDPTRKFSYRTFSLVSNAIDPIQQTALIAPGKLLSLTDTGPQFALGELDRTAVTGSTLAISFGDFVITAVIDQSGSMTWNDRDGLRFDFLKGFLADIDSSVPITSNVSYALVKFRGRRVGSLTITVEGSQQFGLHLDGIRVVRKAGSPPTGISDGLVVFEGLAETFVDDGSAAPLNLGTTYYYSAFPFANLGGINQFGVGSTDLTAFETPGTAPFGVAGFKSAVSITDSFGAPLATGATDFGYRKVHLSWTNPAGFNYTTVTVVRRDDRPPSSPIDGTVLLSAAPTTTVQLDDDFGGAFQPITGLTYYYAIFTQNALGIKCLLPNAMQTSAAIPSVPRPWEQIEPPGNVPPVGFDVTPPLPPVINVTPSSGEMMLTWTPADLDTKRYKLYYDPLKFPTPLDDKGQTYSGTLLLDGTATSFIHRFLTNGQPHFYVLIALDLVENASTPVSPLISGRPPKPSATATTFFGPDPVTGFTVEVQNATSTIMRWKNPQAPASVQNNPFYFGDTVRVIAEAQFLDPGVSQSFLTFQFIKGVTTVGNFSQDDPVDPSVAIQIADVPSTGTSSIAAVVSVTPLLDLQNKMDSVTTNLSAALRVVNRVSGEVLAEISTQNVTIKFQNPFTLSIDNDPPQSVSIRNWSTDPNSDPNDPCPDKLYILTSIPGVYVLSGNPFFGALSSSFRGQPLSGPLDVTVQLLDTKTKLPTTLVTLPGANDQNVSTLTISNTTDEAVDRSGAPTGELETKSVLPLTLPPSNVPGGVTIVATGTFNGYTKTVSLDMVYQPVLNVDVNVTPFQPDNVDRTEQSAFVYFAPFDAPDDQKVPVPDFTVTTWTIKPLCQGEPIRPLVSEDNVPGLGVKAYTRGGLAQKVFWGPGDGVDDDQLYEVHVTALVGGQTAEGFGLLRLSPVQLRGANRIFLRSPRGFYLDSIYSDGSDISTWEVVARPEDDSGSGPTDFTSGQSFRTAVVTAGGQTPSLDDGRVVTMSVKLADASDKKDPNSPSAGTLATVLDSVRIRTNLTGPNGKSKSAKAQIENGKATFQISINAAVPPKAPTVTEEELQDNTYYKIFGVQFQQPQSGLFLTLTVNTPVEINGQSVSFVGGGGSLVDSSPPAFIELKEPLLLA